MNKPSKMYTEPKRILVTGGAGFLGSHLCDRLLSDGHEVLCVDNLFTGRKQNIYHLLDNPKFEFMRHDVTFPLFVEVDAISRLSGYNSMSSNCLSEPRSSEL
jgi:UDP-glucuronate decarboxylase